MRYIVFQPGPPLYRHPPTVQGRNTQDIDDDNINETVLSAASLSGAPVPHFYNPCDNMIWTQNGPYPQYVLAPPFQNRQPSFEQHTKVSVPNTEHVIPISLKIYIFASLWLALSWYRLSRTAPEVGVIVGLGAWACTTDKSPISTRCLITWQMHFFLPYY